MPNNKINLTGTALCESERTVLSRTFLLIQIYCAPHVPTDYFCRCVAYNNDL